MAVMRSGRGVGGFKGYRGYCADCGGTGRREDWTDCQTCEGRGSANANTSESARVSQNLMDRSRDALDASIARARGQA